MPLSRTAQVVTPLGEETLLFSSMHASEALGQPFRFELELLSEADNLDLSQLLGQPVQVMVDLMNGALREFNGLVAHFSLAGTQRRHIRYRAVLRPQVWFLRHTANCRIFQNKSALEVAMELLRERGMSDFEDATTSTYAKREYLVQYRESDLNFLQRILEDEGIYYFFRHRDGKHYLVLADAGSAHEANVGYETVPYFPPLESDRRERDHIDHWHVSRQVRTGAYALADYDFKQPALDLLTTLEQPQGPAALADWQVFDYPGAYRDLSSGKDRARVRLEEEQWDLELVEAAGTARGLSAGALFTLSGFPRDDQNKEYLIVSGQYDVRVNEYGSVAKADELPDFRCRLVAIDSRKPYRPRRTARKAIVEGPQTAYVVGQRDQEIWTDEYGRVKVQFYWDRYGEFDEESSCWVRVSQLWAGSGFGGVHLPRIGQEVIVDFLEGDPDRPIITGRVYNRDNMPPYVLPAKQTQSGIKSRSTKGGAPENCNEIRFEDKKGAEEFYVQAEKNQTILVKCNQSSTIQKNRSASVGGDDSISVTGDRSLSVHGNLSVSVDGAGKGPIQSSMNVTGKHNLHASDTIDMDAPTHIKLECGGSSILIEPGKITITAGGGAQLVLDPNVLAQSNDGTKIVLDANAFTQASGGAQTLLDGNVLAQSSGNSSLLLDSNAAITSNGDVTLDGMTVTGSGKTQATLQVTSNSVQCSPAGTVVGGNTVNINGNGMVSVAGPLIKIG
jgi:type VI secretion system secreted protein VgrG